MHNTFELDNFNSPIQKEFCFYFYQTIQMKVNHKNSFFLDKIPFINTNLKKVHQKFEIKKLVWGKKRLFKFVEIMLQRHNCHFK